MRLELEIADCFAMETLSKLYSRAKNVKSRVEGSLRKLNEKYAQDSSDSSWEAYKRQETCRYQTINLLWRIERAGLPLIKAMQKLEEEPRVVLAYALDLNELIRFSCHNNFDHYKTPTDCGDCKEAEENLRKVELLKYFKPRGDRVYGTEREEIEKIIFSIIPQIKDPEKAQQFSERIK